MKCTALVDPAAARAYREIQALVALVDALAPLPTEKRSRVLEAVCVLEGFDDLADKIRRMRLRGPP